MTGIRTATASESRTCGVKSSVTAADRSVDPSEFVFGRIKDAGLSGGVPSVRCPGCGSTVYGRHRTIEAGDPGRFVYVEGCPRCGRPVVFDEPVRADSFDGVDFPITWVSRNGRWGLSKFEPAAVRWDPGVVGMLAVFCSESGDPFMVYLRDDGTLQFGIDGDEEGIYPYEVLSAIRRRLSSGRGVRGSSGRRQR